MVRSKAARVRLPVDEIMGKWRTLSLAERGEIMFFRDKGLVATVAAALHAIQASHETAAAIGVQPTDCQDLFKSTILLGAFSAKCYGQATGDDNACVAFKTSTLALCVHAEFLESEEIFDECKRVLPDFLCPKNRRKQLPLPYWKQLWEATPTTSLSCLEKLFAQTIEQAMWLMASDPRLGNIKTEITSSTETVSEELDESWMEDDAAASKSSKASLKTRKKKQKKNVKHALLGNSPNHTADVGDSSPTTDCDDLQSPASCEVETEQADREWHTKWEQISRTPASFDPTSFQSSSNSSSECVSDSNLTTAHKDLMDAEPMSANRPPREGCEPNTEPCNAMNESLVIANARSEHFPATIKPPPGLEQVGEYDGMFFSVDCPMKVVPRFAKPMVPHKLHCFGGILCSFEALGHSQSEVLGFNSYPPFENQKGLHFPWLPHPGLPQTFLDDVLHPAIGA